MKIHQTADTVSISDAASYDVSVKVGNTLYVVLYSYQLREETVKYAAVRDLLVSWAKAPFDITTYWGNRLRSP